MGRDEMTEAKRTDENETRQEKRQRRQEEEGGTVTYHTPSRKYPVGTIIGGLTLTKCLFR
jgi:hypothetical protein